MPQVDRPAPNLFVEEWVQGELFNIDRGKGNVILIEIFQVNCPGGFIHGLPEKKREFIAGQVKANVRQKPYDAKTFDTYGLMGTPSSILIDKKGFLRHKLFGAGLGLEGLVQSLLEE